MERKKHIFTIEFFGTSKEFQDLKYKFIDFGRVTYSESFEIEKPEIAHNFGITKSKTQHDLDVQKQTDYQLLSSSYR